MYIAGYALLISKNFDITVGWHLNFDFNESKGIWYIYNCLVSFTHMETFSALLVLCEGSRWISLTNDRRYYIGLRCFLVLFSEQAVEQSTGTILTNTKVRMCSLIRKSRHYAYISPIKNTRSSNIFVFYRVGADTFLSIRLSLWLCHTFKRFPRSLWSKPEEYR